MPKDLDRFLVPHAVTARIIPSGECSSSFAKCSCGAADAGLGVPPSRRYAQRMKRVIGTALGALTGLAFSTLGLIDFTEGLPVMSGGGNKATPLVVAIGVAIGALVGATVLSRFPFALVGMILGLTTAMWLRDNLGLGGVQPPWVFLLLFGLPAVGLAGGYLMHLPRSTWVRHTTVAGALVGLASGLLTYAAASILWAAATHDPACDPTPLPGGGVRVPLCPDSGTPVWLPLLAILLGLAVALFTRNKLSSEPES